MRAQRKHVNLAIYGLLFGFAASSMNLAALISAQAGVGLDTMKVTDSGTTTTMTGTEMSARVQLDPLPLIPAGVGIKAWVPMLDGKTSASSSSKLAGLGVDLDVSVWSPIAFFGFKPYGRLGYTVFGKQAIKDKMDLDFAGTTATIEVARDYGVSGSQLAVGTYWSFLPLIRLMFEVGYRDHEYKPSKSTVQVSSLGTDIDLSFDSFKAKTTTFMVGVDVGI